MDRRRFLDATWKTALGAVALGLGVPRRAFAAKPDLAALAGENLVYVSPLKSDGQESQCHGEVWFGIVAGDLVLITASDRWKARSVGAGLDRARLWFGDRGVYKSKSQLAGLPGFDAKAELFHDDAVLTALMDIYEKKYPGEIRKWRPRMEKGHADKSRVLIRYRVTA